MWVAGSEVSKLIPPQAEVTFCPLYLFLSFPFFFFVFIFPRKILLHLCLFSCQTFTKLAVATLRRHWGPALTPHGQRLLRTQKNKKKWGRERVWSGDRNLWAFWRSFSSLYYTPNLTALITGFNKKCILSFDVYFSRSRVVQSVTSLSLFLTINVRWKRRVALFHQPLCGSHHFTRSI